jgi:hypothetical protein
MRFDSVKELKGEVFRRLTGIQRNTFEAMAAVLSDALWMPSLFLRFARRGGEPSQRSPWGPGEETLTPVIMVRIQPQIAAYL